MSDNKINFTKKALEDLTLPSHGKRNFYYDIKTRGLAISVTSKGTKTFVVYRKVDGKPERVTLGVFPDLSIENARNLASEVNSKIAQGKNPNAEKRNIKEDLDLAQLFEQYMERYSKIHKKSWQGDLNLYNYYLTKWKEKKIALIKKNRAQPGSNR